MVFEPSQYHAFVIVYQSFFFFFLGSLELNHFQDFHRTSSVIFSPILSKQCMLLWPT